MFGFLLNNANKEVCGFLCGIYVSFQNCAGVEGFSQRFVKEINI